MDFPIDRSQDDEAKASSSDEKMPSGAKYQTLVDGVDKELTCAICLSRYNNPKVLPCLHSYCKSCLEGLLKSPLTKQKAGLFTVTEKAPHLQETRWLTCPQCKETHEVPPQGIDSFKTYFTINNLLELLHIHEVSSGNGGGVGDTVVKCESGLDENTAYARCLTCAEYICEKCFTIHKRLKATKDHNVVTLEKIKQSDKKLGVKSVQQRQYCDEHEDEVLKLFCKTCEKVICRDCALVKHRGHNYVFIREVRPETQKQLEALQKEVETKEKEFQSHKKYIGDLQKQNEDALSECLKEVNGACDKIIEAVESRRAALIVDVHEVHEAEEAKRKEELNTVDLSLVRLSDSVRFTRNLLESSDDVEMMTVGLQAMSTLKGLRKMTWDKEKVKPNLMRLKFSPLTDKIKTHGNVVKMIEPSDLSVENLPQDAYVDEEVKFTVKLSDEISKRKYDAASILSVKVTTKSKSKDRNVEVKVQNAGLNKWTVSITPTIMRQHTVEVKIGQFVTKSLCFTVLKRKPTVALYRSDFYLPTSALRSEADERVYQEPQPGTYTCTAVSMRSTSKEPTISSVPYQEPQPGTYAYPSLPSPTVQTNAYTCTSVRSTSKEPTISSVPYQEPEHSTYASTSVSYAKKSTSSGFPYPYTCTSVKYTPTSSSTVPIPKNLKAKKT